MKKRKPAWQHSGSHPRLPVTGKGGCAVASPGSARVHDHGCCSFGERNILVRNSHFRTVPTLISSGLQMNFWYDRPILIATNHQQRTTNLPTLPCTRSCECETSLHASSCVVPQSPSLWVSVHFGTKFTFFKCPNVDHQQFAHELLGQLSHFYGHKIESAADALDCAPPTTNLKQQTTNKTNISVLSPAQCTTLPGRDD